MDDKKLRGISEETLERVLGELSPDFIATLPADPSRLLHYATRRADPVISANISYELGRKMLDYRLSDEEYLKTYFRIAADVFAGRYPEQEGKAYVLLAQTGAGKTKLREKTLRQDTNTVVINSDEYKKFRADAEQIRREDPVHFGALTGIDCYDHARNIVTFAVENAYNILIEVAPSLQQGMVGVDLEQLKRNGYEIHFQFLAVGDLVSGLAIHKRYEDDLEKKKPGAKLTDLKRHEESYQALEKSLEEAGKVEGSKIEIYVRGKGIDYLPERVSTEEGASEESKRVLQKERERSNFEYVMTRKFEQDYQEVKGRMKQREALPEEQRQLEMINEKYELYFVKRLKGLGESR